MALARRRGVTLRGRSVSESEGLLMSPKALRRLVCVALALGLLAVAAVSSGCASDSSGGGSSGTASSDAATSTGSAPAAQDSGQSTQQPGEEPLYTASYKPNGNEIAVIKTPRGVVKFKFYPKDAPNTVYCPSNIGCAPNVM